MTGLWLLSRVRLDSIGFVIDWALCRVKNPGRLLPFELTDFLTFRFFLVLYSRLWHYSFFERFDLPLTSSKQRTFCCFSSLHSVVSERLRLEVVFHTEVGLGPVHIDGRRSEVKLVLSACIFERLCISGYLYIRLIIGVDHCVSSYCEVILASRLGRSVSVSFLDTVLVWNRGLVPATTVINWLPDLWIQVYARPSNVRHLARRAVTLVKVHVDGRVIIVNHADALWSWVNRLCTWLWKVSLLGNIVVPGCLFVLQHLVSLVIVARIRSQVPRVAVHSCIRSLSFLGFLTFFFRLFHSLVSFAPRLPQAISLWNFPTRHRLTLLLFLNCFRSFDKSCFSERKALIIYVCIR